MNSVVTTGIFPAGARNASNATEKQTQTAGFRRVRSVLSRQSRCKHAINQLYSRASSTRSLEHAFSVDLQRLRRLHHVSGSGDHPGLRAQIQISNLIHCTLAMFSTPTLSNPHYAAPTPSVEQVIFNEARAITLQLLQRSAVAFSVFAQLKSVFELASQSESHRQLFNTPSTISTTASSSSSSSSTSSSSSSTSSSSSYTLSLSPTSSNSARAASSNMDDSDDDNDNDAGNGEPSKKRKVTAPIVFHVTPRRKFNSRSKVYAHMFLSYFSRNIFRPFISFASRRRFPLQCDRQGVLGVRIRSKSLQPRKRRR
jgi:hypothetical protein